MTTSTPSDYQEVPQGGVDSRVTYEPNTKAEGTTGEG